MTAQNKSKVLAAQRRHLTPGGGKLGSEIRLRLSSKADGLRPGHSTVVDGLSVPMGFALPGRPGLGTGTVGPCSWPLPPVRAIWLNGSSVASLRCSPAERRTINLLVAGCVPHDLPCPIVRNELARITLLVSARAARMRT